jgi:hypothetical protein
VWINLLISLKAHRAIKASEFNGSIFFYNSNVLLTINLPTIEVNINTSQALGLAKLEMCSVKCQLTLS